MNMGQSASIRWICNYQYHLIVLRAAQNCRNCKPNFRLCKMTFESWEGEMLNNMNNLKFEFKVSFEHLIKTVLTQQTSVHRTIFRQSNCWKLINNWQHGGLLKFASICDKPLQWASIPKHPILTNYVTWMLMSAKLPNVKYEVMIVEAPNFFWFLFLLRIIVKFVPL